jgi:hypothetical protein
VNCLASAILNSSVIIWPCYAFLLFTGAECWFRSAALMLAVEDMDSDTGRYKATRCRNHTSTMPPSISISFPFHWGFSIDREIM